MNKLTYIEENYLSTYPVQVRWVDMDAYRHVNNARYFDYMVEARADYLANLLKDLSVQYVLVRVTQEFKKPLTYPADIVINQYFHSMTRTTFTLHYVCCDRENNNNIYAIGECVLVCVDGQTFKPVPIPEVLKAKFTR